MTAHAPALSTAAASVRSRAIVATGGLVMGLSTGAAGEAVIHEGARGTGELALDQTISQHRDAALTELSRGVDFLLSPVVGPLLIAVVAAILFVRGQRAAGIILAFSTAGLWLATGALKVVFARSRPTAAGIHALVVETKADSFPSGHTAMAAAMVAGAYFTLKTLGRSGRPALLIGAPIVLAVAATRLYLGAHFLGDVTASILFVTAFALIASAFRPWLADVLTRRLETSGR